MERFQFLKFSSVLCKIKITVKTGTTPVSRVAVRVQPTQVHETLCELKQNKTKIIIFKNMQKKTIKNTNQISIDRVAVHV